MKNNKWTTYLGLVMVGLVLFNIHIFLMSTRLSDQIAFFDKETKQMKHTNVELETKLYAESSLEKAASTAAQLNFTKKAGLYQLDDIGVAMK